MSIDAVFIKIVNRSIAAGWLILVVMLVRLLLKKAPKWISCVLWAFVAVRLLCPFSMESVLSLVPSRETIPDEIFFYEGTQQHTPVWIDVVDNPAFSQGVSLPTGQTVSVVQTRAVFGTMIWLAGMAALLLYALISSVRLKRTVAAAVPVKDGILACDEVKSPFILGVIKPLIYVPSSMTGPTLDCVITHETAHIRRHDHWWKPFGFLLLAVYWFAPLCWLAYILFCRDIEMACDEKVIRGLDNNDKAVYSQALLDCSCPRRKLAVCPLAFGEVGVKERVRSVLNYRKPAFWVIVAAVAVCIAVAVCFMTDPMINGPDLSFLNYENACSLVADVTDVDTVYYPPTEKDEDGQICIGSVNGKDLARYLDSVSWQERKAPQERLPSPGSVVFNIRDDYRITVYQKPRRATVTYGDEVRCYKTHGGDYDSAVRLLYSAATVQVIEQTSDAAESSYRVGAFLPGTDLSHISQTLADRLAQAWDTYTGMTEEQRLASSRSPGVVELEADTWEDCEHLIGVPVEDPLGSLGWLDRTGYFGMESTDPTAPAKHIRLTASSASSDRTVSEISMTAGYRTGRARVTLTAVLTADAVNYTTGSVHIGYAAYEQDTVTSGSGIPVLTVTADAVNNTGYYDGDFYDPVVYWVQDHVFYTLRVFGDAADKAEIQTVFDRLLAEL